MEDWIHRNFKDSKIRILPSPKSNGVDWLNDYIKQHTYYVESDEDKLEKMDIKIIEKFLRKKKLKNIDNEKKI